MTRNCMYLYVLNFVFLGNFCIFWGFCLGDEKVKENIWLSLTCWMLKQFWDNFLFTFYLWYNGKFQNNLRVCSLMLWLVFTVLSLFDLESSLFDLESISSSLMLCCFDCKNFLLIIFNDAAEHFSTRGSHKKLVVMLLGRYILHYEFLYCGMCEFNLCLVLSYLWKRYNRCSDSSTTAQFFYYHSFLFLCLSYFIEIDLLKARLLMLLNHFVWKWKKGNASLMCF